MTKETKIGLLVGLAFIIVFAIILSEKGAPQRPGKPIFSTADGKKTETTPTSTALTGGRLPVETQLDPIVRPDGAADPATALAEEPIEALSGGASEEDALPVLPESLRHILSSPLAQGGPPLAPEDGANNSSLAAAAPINPSPNSGGTTPPSREATEGNPAGGGSGLAHVRGTFPPIRSAGTDTSITAGSFDPVVAAMATEPTAPPAASASPRSGAAGTVPVAIRAVHTVQPGESIGKIAAKYYGRSSPARIRAIFDANRETLASVDQVRADTTLRIPLLKDVESGYEPTTELVMSGAEADAPARAPDGGIRIPSPIADNVTRTEADGGAGRASPGDDRRSGNRRDETRTASSLGGSGADSRRGASREERVITRLYEVMSRDTLSGIARRELGDERRADEIWRLNRDRLSNKHKLKEGIKLRLPVDEPPPRMSISTATHVGNTSP